MFRCTVDMNANFKYHLGELPAFLFPNGAVEQAKLVAGTPILTGDLTNLVGYYVDLLNSNDNLSPHSMSQVNNPPKITISYETCIIT